MHEGNLTNESKIGSKQRYESPKIRFKLLCENDVVMTSTTMMDCYPNDWKDENEIFG